MGDEIITTSNVTEGDVFVASQQIVDESTPRFTLEQTNRAVLSSDKVGKVELCFITEGTGLSSGAQYSRELFSEASSKFSGRPMFVDHSELRDPGVNKWAGDIIEAHYDPNGAKGPGIYGTATVFPRWREVVESFVGSEGGVSIRAVNLYESPRSMKVKKIDEIVSVDYVVRAGRGGEVMALFESALNNNDPLYPEEKQMGTTTNETAAPTLSKEDLVAAVTEAQKQTLEAVLEKFDSFDQRLARQESEGADRRKIAAVVKESDIPASAQSAITEAIWAIREDLSVESANVEALAKQLVGTVGPTYKQSMDEAIADAKKEADAEAEKAAAAAESATADEAGGDRSGNGDYPGKDDDKDKTKKGDKDKKDGDDDESKAKAGESSLLESWSGSYGGSTDESGEKKDGPSPEDIRKNISKNIASMMTRETASDEAAGAVHSAIWEV